MNSWNVSEGDLGKLKNPCNKFFLQMTADTARMVNQERDKRGLTYARKAMIRSGMPLNVDGK